MAGNARWIGWVAPILLWMIAAATYWEAQKNESLPEDARVVWSNPAVSGGDWGAALLGRYEYATDESFDSVRPVATVANRIRHDLFGADRAAYIWTQITLHAVCGTLLALLVGSTLGSSGAGLLVGALFVAHPLTSASVLRLSGFAEQLALAFGLAALLVLAPVVSHPGRTSRRALTTAAAFLLLSLGSKEIAFVWIGVIAAWVLAMNPTLKFRHDRLPGKLAIGTIGIGLGVLIARWVLLTLRPGEMGQTPAVHPDSGTAALERMWIGLGSIWTHLSLLIFPLGLSYTHDYLPSLVGSGPSAHSLAAIALLLVLVSALVLLVARRLPVPVLWGAFLALAITASSGMFVSVGDFLNERTGYFLVPAFVGSLAALLWHLPIPSAGTARKVAFGAAAMVAIGGTVALGLRAADRVRDHINQETLIRATLSAHESPQARYELGNLFLTRGQYASARAEYEAALEGNPELWMAWINLGATFSRMEDFSLAMRAYTRAIDGAGDRPEFRVPIAKARFNRALILMRQNRNEEAVADLEQTVATLPDHLRAHASLAFIYRNSEEFDEKALHHFARAIELESDPEAKRRLEEAVEYIYDRREVLERQEQVRRDAGLPPSKP